MHLTTEACYPVMPGLFEEDTLGLAPSIVLPEPLPDEDDSGDDPLRTYLREIHEVNLLTAADERMLACRMEEMICLDEIRGGAGPRRRRPPERRWHGLAPLRALLRSTPACRGAQARWSTSTTCRLCCNRLPYASAWTTRPDLDLGVTLGAKVGVDAARRRP